MSVTSATQRRLSSINKKHEWIKFSKSLCKKTVRTNLCSILRIYENGHIPVILYTNIQVKFSESGIDDMDPTTEKMNDLFVCYTILTKVTREMVKQGNISQLTQNVAKCRYVHKQYTLFWDKVIEYTVGEGLKSEFAIEEALQSNPAQKKLSESLYTGRLKETEQIPLHWTVERRDKIAVITHSRTIRLYRNPFAPTTWLNDCNRYSRSWAPFKYMNIK